MLGRIFSRPRKRPRAGSLAASIEALEDRTLLSASLFGDAVIIDNGDPGYSTSGEGWNTSTNGGFNGDHAWNAMGDGSAAAEWTFSVEPDTYHVAITWLAALNRATDAPFTVLDGTTELGTFFINQELPPDGFEADGATWHTLGEFTITSGTLTVRLTDAADEFVIADAVRVAPVVDGPRAEVTVDGTRLSDGGEQDLGRTLIGGTLTRTITVTNAGNEDLLLEEPVVPEGFTLAQSFSATTLAAGESATFVLQFHAADLGEVSGEVSFGNNDLSEGPFRFTVTATVAEELIIDNGDPEFSTTGTWSVSTGGGFDGDHAFSAPGDGDVAEWTAHVGPGVYEVSATWLTGANRATDATYTILDGETVVGTVVVNQQLEPGGTEGGWEVLGEFLIISGTLTVRLSDMADNFVIADAVRITPAADDGGDAGQHSECVLAVVREWLRTRPDESLGSLLSALGCEEALEVEAAAALISHRRGKALGVFRAG